jgi:hypothetical protein
MPPVESSAYGTPVTEFVLYKKGWYEHDGKPDLHLGGGRSMRSKDIALCANLRISGLACIQPPPASGQFRRGIVTMPRINKQNR